MGVSPLLFGENDKHLATNIQQNPNKKASIIQSSINLQKHHQSQNRVQQSLMINIILEKLGVFPSIDPLSIQAIPGPSH